MSDRQVTHFADEDTLAYINRLERELAEANAQLDAVKDLFNPDLDRLEIAVIRAVEGAWEDSARLDWLADPDNRTGNVQLPSACVLQNLDSMRNAIDAAMGAGE